MATTHFEHLIGQYENSLVALETTLPQSNTEQILEALSVRDAIHRTLLKKTQETLTATNLVALFQLDARLKKQSGFIAKAIRLADWRASLHPPQEAWWWYFEPSVSAMGHLDWLWSALAVIMLTISLSLILDTSSRFLSGGPDAGASFVVIAQSLLTMLAAGGILTKVGRESFDRILGSQSISKDYWQVIKLATALLLLIGLLGLRFSLPNIAILYNNRGLEHYLAGRYASALFDYNRAIKLNPDYIEAHYNLGIYYEDLQDFARARTEYQIAVQGGLDAASNNLARLYILDGKYSMAIPLLLTALDKVQDNEVRYDLLKNLGWVRLEQKRYAEAETNLQTAINLSDAKAPAHCLLALALEGQKRSDEALREWEVCLKYADKRRPDEDTWIEMARKSLEGGQP